MEDSVKNDDLELFIRQFDESVDNSQSARAASELWRDYYDGNQWTAEETQTLRKRKQPVITDNRIKDKIDYYVGMELQTRTDPKAYPRNPNDTQSAEAATDALRFVADENNFPQVKTGVFQNVLIEGFGGCEVVVETRNGKPKIKQRYIRWDRLYYDPHSLSPDFRDAEYMGIVVWMDVSKAKRKYKALAERITLLVDEGFDGQETYKDKPTRWVDRSRKRVQILEHYYRADGVWHRCVFSRAGMIEPPANVEYLDEHGEPECPLILQSGHVARDGSRYGIVKRYETLQDEINKRRSKALHLLSSRQVQAEAGAVEDVNKSREELARPDGWVETTPGMQFNLLPTSDMAAGQFQLLQEAQNAMAISGPNAAISGQTGGMSGRAKQIDQQTGSVQLGHLLDGIRFWQTRVMRATWNRIRQYWTEETWVRVTDDERNIRFVALNKRTTFGEMEAEKLAKAEMDDEAKAAAVQQIAANPMSMQPTVQNNVAEMDVDIIIDEAPDVITLQQEQWSQLSELAGKGFPIPPEALIEASSLRNKDQILESLKTGGMPPQVQKQIQQAQEQVQQGMEQVQKSTQELSAKEAELRQAEAEIKVAMANLKVQEAEVRAAQAELSAAHSQHQAAMTGLVAA